MERNKFMEKQYVRRWLISCLLLMAVFAGTGWSVSAGPRDPGSYEVTFDFETLAQGTVGVAHVTGSTVQGARARFLNRLIDFYPRDGAWHGLLATNMEQHLNAYPLQVLIWFEDGQRVTWEGEVEVVDGGFIREDITIPSNLGYLLEPETDRTERARLMGLVSQVTPETYWVGAFEPPSTGDFTSPFGTWRLYNEVLWGRHTGIDLRGPIGTPILASAAGRVVMAERLDIRGNHVVIDHGRGVFTGYSHFSEMHVTRGQVVGQGQVIGLVGNTGRSSGPHIHWEVTVNGEWVDAERFLEAEIP